MDATKLSPLLRESISGLHKRLRKQGNSGGWSMTEMQTVGLLFRNPSLLPTELAAQTRVKTQTMSQILKKLEEQKVIIRTPSENDGRKVYISISPTGKKMVEKVRYDCDEWLRQAIEKTLTSREREQLANALPILNKLIEAAF